LCYYRGDDDDKLDAEESDKYNNEIENTRIKLDNIIDGLDLKLDRVLKKQEHDYLKGYSIYVKQKEKELRDLIAKLNEKNQRNTLKDEIIYNLKQTIKKINDEQIKMEKEKCDMKSQIKHWQARSHAFE